MFNLENKTAIISGGSKGIGKAIAFKLAEAGSNIVVCSRKIENLENCHKEAIENGYEIDIIECNTSDKESIKKVVDFTIEKLKALYVDLLIRLVMLGPF